MEHYYEIHLSHLDLSVENWESIDVDAFNQWGCLGIQELSLGEQQLNQFIGDKAICGGQPPPELLEEIEDCFPITGKVFFFDDSQQALGFLKAMQGQYEGLQGELGKKEDQDWNIEWRKTYRPLKIGDQLEIIPKWLEREHQSTCQHSFLLYPGQGFGTGTHETTSLCLEHAVDLLQSKKTQTVLDFGCGSGILGIAAAMIQPDLNVDFYDIDLPSLENCQENIDLNFKNQKNFRVLCSEQKNELEKYDLIFANILFSTLQQEKDFILSHLNPEGKLVLSGLLKEEEEKTQDFFLQEGILTFEKATSKERWTSLVFSRKK